MTYTTKYLTHSTPVHLINTDVSCNIIGLPEANQVRPGQARTVQSSPVQDLVGLAPDVEESPSNDGY
jgi:hypothetical protein